MKPPSAHTPTSPASLSQYTHDPDADDTDDDDAANPASTPHELLDYVAFLENELERMKLHSLALQNKHHDEKIRLKDRLEATLDKMDDTERELHAHKASFAQSHASAERLKDEVRRAERLLQDECRKEKILEDRIQKLELELQMKNDLINHRRKRDERSRKQLEKENEVLKKKATLGWMLGCLSEVYLQSEPEAAAAPLLQLVRNIQRELERENVVLSYSNEPPQIHLEYVEKEIRRLIDCARLAADSGANQAPLVKQSSSSTQKPEDGGIQKESLSDAVVCRPHDSHPSKTRMPEDGGSPSARYIINCFGGDSVRNTRDVASKGVVDDAHDDYDDEEHVARGQLGHHLANDCPSSQAQIEMFEASPDVDVEHTRLSGSTWAELRVMNKRGAEAAEMQHCQADIKRMLSRLEASMQYLLQTQHVQPQGPAALVEEEEEEEEEGEAAEVHDRSIDDIILSAARKAKRKDDKATSSACKVKVTTPASKHKGAASTTKQKAAAATITSPKLKPKKTH